MQAAAASRGPQVSDLTSTIEIIKLVSEDQKIFYLNRDVACQSKFLREAVKTAPRVGNTNTRVIELNNLPATTLETVVKYLHYRCINSRLAQDDRAVFQIDQHEALNILKAAIYLQC